MSSQIEAKKKLMKVKKKTNKINQNSQNFKKSNKIFDNSIKNENIFNSIIIQNNSKMIQKLKDELNNYKEKCQELEEEKIKLNLKIKEMIEKNEKIKKKNEEEKNSDEDNNSFSSQKKNPLKKAIISAYNILIELVELILNQKTYKDKDKENNSTKQIENISMDIYEPSVYNDEERKTLLFEQIQQILIFKLNFVNKVYHLGLENQCERVKNWNINSINTTKDNNKDISFSSFSAISNNKKKSLNVSMSNSDIALRIGITPPHSPKFPGRKDSYSAISNLMDESTIKDLSTSIINYNNGPHFGLGGDSFFLENENLTKSKEDIDNKEQSKDKEVNLINTSFKDLSLIRSGDQQALGNVSFTKNMDKFSQKMDLGDNDINMGETKSKEIIIKNENQFNISFNDI